MLHECSFIDLSTVASTRKIRKSAVETKLPGCNYSQLSSSSENKSILFNFLLCATSFSIYFQNKGRLCYPIVHLKIIEEDNMVLSANQVWIPIQQAAITIEEFRKQFRPYQQSLAPYIFVYLLPKIEAFVVTQNTSRTRRQSSEDDHIIHPGTRKI